MEQKENKQQIFLENHSHRYLEMAFRTEKLQIVEKPDGYGKRTSVCGDTVELFLTIGNDRIQSVSYATNGCMNTNACANTIVVLAEGKSVVQAWEITPDSVSDYLETLPPHEQHCAEIAVGALYQALINYQEFKQSPWKKLYQRR